MNLKNLSLKVKLILGFSIVLTMLLIVSAVSFFALETSSTGFEDYRSSARGSNAGGRIQANLLSARISAVNFINTGSAKSLDEFNSRWKTLTEMQAETESIIKEPEWVSVIKNVRGSLDSYKEGFNRVVEYKNRRNQLVHGVLDVNGTFMEKALTDIMVSAHDDGDLNASYHTGIAMKHLLLARLYMVKFLDTNEQSSVDRVREELEKTIESLNTLDRELQNPKRRELLKTVMEAKDIYAKAFDNLVAAIFERNKVVSDILVRLGGEVSDKIEGLKLDIKKVQDEIGPRLQASNKRAVSVMGLLSLFAVLMSVAIVFVIIRGVMAQLGSDPSEIERIAQIIATGNLAITFDDTKERGVYASMKHMAQNLSGMIKNITRGVTTLESSSGELSDLSGTMASNVEQTYERSNNVAAASEEMSTSMASVAAAMEQTSLNIQSIVSAVEEMSATINEIAGNTSKGSGITARAVKTAEQASRKVDDLGKAALEISKVSESIADISEQTNLLALNATIEAARAGEAGKGFAVVASEIKALAQQTTDATNEINAKISGVQNSTRESVGAIDTIVAIIHEINDIVTTVASAIEEQSATTKEISVNISQAASGVDEVSTNVNQVTSVVEEVNSDINQVNQAANDLKNGSVKVKASSSRLSELAGELKEMVGSFTI